MRPVATQPLTRSIAHYPAVFCGDSLVPLRLVRMSDNSFQSAGQNLSLCDTSDLK
ncbi:hypothetical protein SMJ63A_50299 [Stenotrophomonas geniculata]